MTSDPSTPAVRIGVLAMQGAFAEHVRALEAVGAIASEVRTQDQLDLVDGIVIPGGESTAIRKALDRGGLLEPLRAHIEAGLPAFGTCAGLIVLADIPEPDGAPDCLGLLDVTVERNGFGRQPASAERSVDFTDDTHPVGIFIRAPRITRLGDAVEVLATTVVDGRDEPVVVRDRHLLGATYHPELTADRALHARFVAMVAASR